MDDRQLSPLSSGVMYVAPWQVMYPRIMKLPHHPDHLSRLKADVGVDMLEAELATTIQPSWSFRQLLAQIGKLFARQGPAST